MMLNGLRRSLVALPRGVNKGIKNNMSLISRSLVDLTKKEHGEETIYIRKTEAARKKELEEKMNEILQRHHEDEEKQALVELLDKKEKKIDPREVGIFQYLGLDDWRWALPCAAVIGVPMVTLDVIVIDYKMYLVAVFAMMWHAYGATLLPIWSEKSNWVGEYIRDAWATFDKDAIQQLNSDIKINEEFLHSKAAFQDIFAAIDDTTVSQAVALNLAAKNDHQRAIQSKLDALTTLNETITQYIKNDMIQTVKEDALDLLEDPEMLEEAMEDAIDCLNEGVHDGDLVGEAYIAAIQEYRETLEEPDHPVHEIALELQQEIDEIVEPPEIDTNVGNVYVSHPV